MRPGRVERMGQLVLPYKDTMLWLEEQVPDFDVVVYETFKPRPIDGSMNWIIGDPLLTAQLIGVIRWLAFRHHKTLIAHGPQVKEVALAKMKGAKEARKFKRRMASSTEQHDQDALMHLWAYACDNWEVLGSGPR